MNTGIYIAAITPFQDDEIDFPALKYNIQKWCETDIAGLLLLGSTSEFVFLNTEEKFRLLAFAREHVPDHKTLVAGVGAESVRETMRMIRKAAELGYRYALAVNPYYYKPQISEQVLRTYYLTLAESSPIPLLIYNIPRFTGIAIPPKLILELADHPNIVGIKDSSGNLAQLHTLLKKTSADRFSVFTGDLNGFLQAGLLGVKGGIFAFANATPQEISRVYHLLTTGDVAEATRIMKEVLSLAQATIGRFGIPGLKVAMKYLGYRPGLPRLPFSTPSETDCEEIQKAVQAYKKAITGQ